MISRSTSPLDHELKRSPRGVVVQTAKRLQPRMSPQVWQSFGQGVRGGKEARSARVRPNRLHCWDTAEAAFKKAATKPAETPPPRPSIPNAKGSKKVGRAGRTDQRGAEEDGRQIASNVT